ncbi:MAG: NADPH-dependent FMN reductase [Lautropia sp.]|nr:NADPH-dependent FMN reductase [Lautropia sp.]
MSNILLFNASNSSTSIHASILDAIEPMLAGHALTRRSTRDVELPLFSQDLEREQTAYPQPAQDFLDLIHSHDAIVLTCPEHNSAIPAAFKNLYDWGTRVAMSRKTKLFNERPVLLFSTSGGARGAKTALGYLEMALPFQGASIVGATSIPQYYEHFKDGKPDAATEATIRADVDKLKAVLA